MSTNPSSDISQLITRVAMRDRQAFRRLYNLTSAKLLGVSLRILKDRAEAEEALQEVYVKIWRRADLFAKGDYSPISWLVAIARNHAIDLLRARKPRADDLDAAYAVADALPDPEQTAIAAGESGRIDACLDQLEMDKADCIRGAYLDGYTYEELAERHAVPVNTMRTWLRRSLIKLRECLAG